MRTRRGRTHRHRARRPDTSSVSLTSGGTEIVCFTRTRGHQPRDSWLWGKLPRTPRVVAVTAHCLLRMFFGGATGWNGRSESTIHRRLEHLRHTGTLFFDVDIDPRLLGFTCEAMLWLSVPPRQTRRPRSHPRHPPRSRLRRRHHRTDQPRRPLDALAGYGAGLWIATGARRPRTLTLAEFDLAGLWVVHTHPTRPSMLVRGRRGPIDTAPLRSPAIRHKEELLFEAHYPGCGDQIREKWR